MMRDTDKALEILTQALDLERRGQNFYRQAAREVSGEKGRDVFASLADDEEKHAAMIERQMRALQEQRQYEPVPGIRAPDIDLDRRLFPPEGETREAEFEGDINVLDALHFALDMEMRAHSLYTDAAKKTEDEEGKKLYMWLADAELTHFDLLMTNYESQVTMGGWV